MGTVNDTLAIGNLIHVVDKNGTLLLKFLHHKAVVDNLFTNVNWWPEGFEGNADNINGPHHTGAESPRF